MGVQRGDLASLTYAGTNIGNLTNATINVNTNEIETSDFDTNQFKTYIEGRRDITIDFTARLNLTGTPDGGQEDMLEKILGTSATVIADGDSQEVAITWQMLTAATTEDLWTANGFLTSFSKSFPDEDVAELSGTIRIVSKPTPSAQS